MCEGGRCQLGTLLPVLGVLDGKVLARNRTNVRFETGVSLGLSVDMYPFSLLIFACLLIHS